MQKANVVLPATDPRGDGGKESGIQNEEKITEMRPNVRRLRAHGRRVKEVW